MTSQSFVIELPIAVDDAEMRTIVRKLEFARQLHNATLGTAMGQLQQMRQDAAWKEACVMPKGKERAAAFRALDRKYGLTEYDLHSVIARHREGSGRKAELGINETQKIATRVFQAINRYKLGLGGMPRFKSSKRGLHSIEGKTNKTGLKFRPEKKVLNWCGHDYRVLIDPKDDYIQRALKENERSDKYRKIKYCRLVRKRIRSADRFFLQVVLEGTAPVKHVYAPVTERAAIDPGPQSIALFSKAFAGKIQVAGPNNFNEAASRRLLRAMDRSLKRNNPDAYNEDGTIKKGAKLVKSKNYQRKVDRLREMHRVSAAERRCLHGQTINLLLSIAGDIRIEKNSWKAFQRGHFGKSLGKSAMSGFIAQLKSKAASAGLKVTEVNPYKLKLSQYDPYTDTYRKKDLSERWQEMKAGSGQYIQRDILSALLLYCADIEKEIHIPKVAVEQLEGAKQFLTDAGYVVLKSTSSRDQRDLRLAPEPKAMTPEMARQKILRGAGDSHLPTDQALGRIRAGEKVSTWSKETFPL